MPQVSRRVKILAITLIVFALLIVGRVLFPAPMPHIQLPAEEVTSLFGFPITNTMITSWLSMLVLVVVSWAATRNMQLVPARLQGLMEALIEVMLGLVEDIAGREKGRRFFPLVATIFLFLLISNWMGLLPGYGTIGVIEPAEHGGYVAQKVHIFGLPINLLWGTQVGEHEHGFMLRPFLRSAATDLNVPLALALISVGVTQIFGVRALGLFGYGSRFLSLGGIVGFLASLVGLRPRKGLVGQLFTGILDLFVGLLETISEFAKIISFSFRLFGNIFAGEVLLGVMAFLIPWVAALPFLGLEIFVGLMQAFVFAFLTLVFLTIATTHHGSAEH